MGQKSSQVNRSAMSIMEEEQAAYPRMSQRKRQKGKKGRKEKRNGEMLAERADQEEESINVLLQSKRDAVFHDKKSYEDELAASTQLLSESSPSRHSASYNIMNWGIDQKETAQSLPLGESTTKTRKRKRQSSGYLQYDGNNLSRPGDLAHNASSNEAKTSHHIVSSAERSHLPQPTLSLDDIDSADEAVASYLQEYEDDVVSATPQLSSQPDIIESDSQMQQLVANISHYESDALNQPTSELPLNGDSLSVFHKNPKQRSRSRLNLVMDEPSDQVLSNGTVRPTLNYEPFDNYIDDLSAFANNSPQLLGDTPISPNLTQNGGALALFGDGPMFNTKENSPQNASRKGKSKRVRSSNHLRGQEENPLDDNSHDLSPENLAEFEGRQDDTILSRDKDVQHFSSTRSSYEPSVEQSSNHISSDVETQHEKAPSLLSKPRPKKKQQGENESRTKKNDPSVAEKSDPGGMFTKAEMAKIDALRESYCQEWGTSVTQFNQLIHAPVRQNKQVQELWGQLYELVPYRAKMSVSRFCRRRFHNYSARGSWTPSEDESLKLAVAEKGTSWKQVGKMIDRFPEDCRDRYRNYHGNAANRNRQEWTIDEIRKLCQAVYDCMKLINAEQRRAKEGRYFGRDIPESDVESDPEIIESSLIHWPTVSEHMSLAGGSRSRLQCATKWASLKTAQRRKYWSEIRAVMRGKKLSEPNKSARKWRLERAIKKLRNMKTGDRYDFLQAFSTCGATEEANIPWRQLGDKEFRDKWDLMDMKGAWAIFKGEIPEADKMDCRDVANRLLMKLMVNDGHRLHQRWDPAVDGDVNVALKKAKAERMALLKAKTSERKFKSEHLVSPEADEEHTEQNGRGHSVEKVESQDHQVAGDITSSISQEDANEVRTNTTGQPSRAKKNTSQASSSSSSTDGSVSEEPVN